MYFYASLMPTRCDNCKHCATTCPFKGFTWDQLRPHLVLDPFEWNFTCGKGHVTKITYESVDTQIYLKTVLEDTCPDFESLTKKKLLVYPTRFERILEET
jgi:Fe-S-cluster-containing hydrogenase component 2